jgi:hypothetical protein
MIKQLDPNLVDEAVAQVNATLKRLLDAGRMSVPT